MSEHINNVTQRKALVKQILSQINTGTPVEEVKAKYGSLVSQISSTELSEVEQELIREGTPISEIQNLCDVHVAVFRDLLDGNADPQSQPGHPIHTFLTENRRLEQHLDEIQASLNLPEDWKTISARIFEQLQTLMTYDRHYLRKENLLFPYLEQRGFTGPSKVMWGKHDEIRAQLKALARLLAFGNASQTKVTTRLSEVSQAMREMIYKEEKILFPASLEYLNHSQWAAIRAHEDEIGYFILEAPTLLSVPEVAAFAPQQVEMASPTSTVQLDTGFLTAEQINLMLVNLPVDVTYVDENDEVRYYSQTRERIFTRTAAIIGRKVQNCHPPQSVHRVQKILDDFRAGTRSNAEFWIQMGGRFIHIRYFALRDTAGTYKGTLEVSQDATEIRQLEGERRLLDD